MTYKFNIDRPMPSIGEQLTISRPRDLAYLPAIYIDQDMRWDDFGMTVLQAHDKFSWYSFEGGPVISTILSEYEYRPENRKLHWLVAEHRDGPYEVLAHLDKLHEYSAVFTVAHAAPTWLIREFEAVLGEARHEVALKTASNWHNEKLAAMSMSRSGHTLYFEFTAGCSIQRALDWAQDLYERLPSGSGFDNSWHLVFKEKHVEASTSYSPINGETGMYESDIDLQYDLRYDGIKWHMQDLNEGQDDEDGHYEYCADSIEEALNDA